MNFQDRCKKLISEAEEKVQESQSQGKETQESLLRSEKR
jgi:hypothetical protein